MHINKKHKGYFMHRVILNPPEGMDTDHINRNPLDNRRCNLRISTRTQNNANSKLRVNNTSGRKGVSWDKYRCIWSASIRIHGKTIHLGRFNELEQAANAYSEKARVLFGVYARIE